MRLFGSSKAHVAVKLSLQYLLACFIKVRDGAGELHVPSPLPAVGTSVWGRGGISSPSSYFLTDICFLTNFGALLRLLHFQVTNWLLDPLIDRALIRPT